MTTILLALAGFTLASFALMGLLAATLGRSSQLADVHTAVATAEYMRAHETAPAPLALTVTDADRRCGDRRRRQVSFAGGDRRVAARRDVAARALAA